ncbi:MAG: hypothetical protein LBT45_04100 [Rickettsiales bacterium]|nr:hypothetical protein [Rickettsiales bacterium]
MLNNKPSGNKKQKSSNVKPIIAGFGIGLMTFAGCGDKNGGGITNPPACNCPDKIHGNAPYDCGGIDCECEQRYYTLNCGIVLEDTTGQIIASHIEIINEILDECETTGINNLINKGIRIKVISGNSNSRDGAEISIGIDNWNKGKLEEILSDNFIEILSHVNNFNSNIHLTKWNLTPQK